MDQPLRAKETEKRCEMKGRVAPKYHCMHRSKIFLSAQHAFVPTKENHSPEIFSPRALVLTPGHTQALVRRAQAQESLGRFRRAVEDLEAAEATLEGGTRATHPWNCRGGFAERDGEVAEVKRRLEHARWTKVRGAKALQLSSLCTTPCSLAISV